MRSIHARTACALLAALAVTLLSVAPAVAAPPANDDFDSAVAITALPFEATQDTAEATRAADDPECVDGDGHTVWYSFTPSADVDVVVDTFGSDYDTTLSAWTGTRGALSQVACNDDFQSLQSRIAFTANAGVTYHLMVGSFLDSPAGTLVLHAQELPPPMQLTFALGPTGSVDRAGAATLRGSLGCSREGTVTVTGTLRQQVGKRVTVGSFRTTVACDGTESWSATVVGETGQYRHGSAQGVALAEFVDVLREEVVRARDAHTVQLS
jgi:hypothetical protein